MILSLCTGKEQASFRQGQNPALDLCAIDGSKKVDLSTNPMQRTQGSILICLAPTLTVVFPFHVFAP